MRATGLGADHPVATQAFDLMNGRGDLDRLIGDAYGRRKPRHGQAVLERTLAALDGDDGAGAVRQLVAFNADFPPSARLQADYPMPALPGATRKTPETNRQRQTRLAALRASADPLERFIGHFAVGRTDRDVGTGYLGRNRIAHHERSRADLLAAIAALDEVPEAALPAPDAKLARQAAELQCSIQDKRINQGLIDARGAPGPASPESAATESRARLDSLLDSDDRGIRRLGLRRLADQIADTVFDCRAPAGGTRDRSGPDHPLRRFPETLPAAMVLYASARELYDPDHEAERGQRAELAALPAALFAPDRAQAAAGWRPGKATGAEKTAVLAALHTIGATEELAELRRRGVVADDPRDPVTEPCDMVRAVLADRSALLERAAAIGRGEMAP